jgi:lysozyme family protein
MAEYGKSLSVLLGFDGAYANDPSDPGGETYCGIARHYNPGWAGWATVDAHRIGNFPAVLSTDEALQQDVAQFYVASWKFSPLAQSVADKMLCLVVLHGQMGGTKIAQQALVRLGYRVEVDGVMGDETLALIGKVAEQDMLHGLRAYSAIAAAEDVIRQPGKGKFLEGWVWRATA